MKKTILYFLVSFVFLSGCTVLSQQSLNEIPQRKTALSIKQKVPIDFVQQNIKVVVLGDSLTEGVGDPTNQGGYVPFLKELLEEYKGINKVEITNFGVKGHRSSQLLNRLEKVEIQNSISDADIVLITIGGNDLLKVVSENITGLTVEDFNKEKEVYSNNLRKIVSKIQNINEHAVISLIGLYNPFSTVFIDIKELDQIISDWNQNSQSILAQYKNTLFIDIADLFLGDIEALLHTDFFHPNRDGYELIAGRIFSVLEEQILDELPNKHFIVKKLEISIR